MNRRGQALVEFVLILPIFILILFAVVDFGTILNKKSHLENISVDIITMLANGENIDDIKVKYPQLSISKEEDEKYTQVFISENINIITPGLNLIFGNPYKVTIERTVPNAKTE